MGVPYLENGESIIMTTDRVSVESIAYDAILTTRRLLLIDSRHARSEPRIIPLSAIESLRSGKAATGEPVIILALKNPGDPAAETKIIIFSQEPLENRKQDRDLWVQKFIELSVSDREEIVGKEVPLPRKPEGMNPSTRRWVAPEILRPHTERYRTKPEVQNIEIIPDEMEPHQIQDPKKEQAGNAAGNFPQPQAGSGQGYEDFLARATQTALQSITMPDSPASLQPPDKRTERTGTTEDSGTFPVAGRPESPEPVSDIPSPLSRSILAATRSLTSGTGPEAGVEITRAPGKTVIRTTSTLPEIPVQRTEPEPVREKIPPLTPAPPGEGDLNLHEEIPGRVRNTSVLTEILRPSPLMDEPVDPLAHQDLPDTAPGSYRNTTVPAGNSPVPTATEKPADSPGDWVEPEPAVQAILPEPCNTDTMQEPSGNTGGLSPAPASGLHPILIAGGAILCLLLVLAGIVFLPGMLPQDHGTVTPVPTPVPTPTAVMTPVPTPGAIYQEGVWVRIVSPTFFIGQAGQPGIPPGNIRLG